MIKNVLATIGRKDSTKVLMEKYDESLHQCDHI